tara:strand:- start:324 stop:587 length:264 start_codon:yes stop_codon:yes gene_type:complete
LIITIIGAQNSFGGSIVKALSVIYFIIIFIGVAVMIYQYKKLIRLMKEYHNEQFFMNEYSLAKFFNCTIVTYGTVLFQAIAYIFFIE